jgi:Ca2+-transporting ATPase
MAIADELRPEAKRAIQAAERAGVAVKMITGDHFETAFHIGQELGIVETRDQVFDARKMATMSDEELTSVVEQTRVFSRVIPEDKYRILMIMKQTGVIAMTGDGVNDVPALSSAHVGFAMGSGSQMAKDAGDIVLLDDNFRHIVEAISEGRTVFANIRRMIVYLFSTNIGEVLTALGALAMGMPAPLLPIQILWVNLVTDSALVIPLGLEPGEKTNMLHPPRSPKAPVLSKFIVSRLAVMAIAMAATVLTMYIIFDKQYGDAYANTIAFSALVVIQWSSALCVRSTYESIFKRIRVWSGAFVVGMSIAVSVQVLAMFGPLQEVMHVSNVKYLDLLVTGLIAFVVPVVVSEIHKLIGRRLLHKN